MSALTHPLPSTDTPRMARLARLPVFFALTNKRVVIAGGSAAAAWKAELLSAAGARVDVYSANAGEELAALECNPPGGAVRIVSRDWAASDLSVDSTMTPPPRISRLRRGAPACRST
jgi:uroporphyrin-III C-methyltransferase/precorrin-2 dehydrogenase/sirohydrochlorin ferrochelatase